jgi:hypothetical protein
MNDPVIERVAREDPATHAAGGGPEHEAMLARLRTTIDAPPPRAARRQRRGRLIATLGAVVVAAVVAGVAIVIARSHHARTVVNFTNATRPPRLTPDGTVHIGTGPADLLIADGSLWVAGEGYIARVDPHDGRIQARIKGPATVIGPAQLAAGAGSIWVAYQGQGQVQRIDPRTDRLVASIRLPDSASGGGIAVADGKVWASALRPGRHGHVMVIDPHTDRVAGPAAAVGTGTARLHTGLGSVWAQNTSDPDATASRINPRTRVVQQLAISGEPMVGFGHLWTLAPRSPGGATVLRRYLPGESDSSSPSATFPRAITMAFGAGRVWVLSGPRTRGRNGAHAIPGTATVTPVSPVPSRYALPMGPPITLGDPGPFAIAISGDELWIADYGAGELLHFRIHH